MPGDLAADGPLAHPHACTRGRRGWLRRLRHRALRVAGHADAAGVDGAGLHRHSNSGHHHGSRPGRDDRTAVAAGNLGARHGRPGRRGGAVRDRHAGTADAHDRRDRRCNDLRSLAWRTALALAAVATLGSLALTLGSARNRAWVSTLYSTVTDAGQPLKQDEAAQLTSERAPLARMALAIWSDSPLFGAGANGFAVENKRRTAADPDFYGCSPERTALIAKLTSAHNAFLDEAAARGVVGISLLAALVATCAWWAWKADPSTATLGMLAAWFGLSLTTPASLRTVPMMLLALIVARTSMLAGCRRPLG
ncbi:MAG: O-antigen ligase domain-containing protein [Rhodospirillales bacterium]|nr:O-antigen ligase domain-containing protein [Rhodospirillales bacterium]